MTKGKEKTKVSEKAASIIHSVLFSFYTPLWRHMEQVINYQTINKMLKRGKYSLSAKLMTIRELNVIKGHLFFSLKTIEVQNPFGWELI